MWRSFLTTPYTQLELGDGAATREHRERCVSGIHQKEPYFSPPVQRSEHREMEVGINSMCKSDEDVHATQNYSFRTQVLPEPAREM
jgi:hypothetical protein